MNPNSPQPNFELPTPQSIGGAEVGNQQAEQPPARPEQAPQPSVAQPASAQPTPLTDINTQSVPSPAPLSQASQTPIIADDNDLIEKEWVTKAKQIVSATKEDPHMQNREISRFKADYLKKRYNKDIKLEDA